MVITMVKGTSGVDHDRVYIGSDTGGRRAAVHAVHDLPHLVVESLFGISDGLWGELAAGHHPDANRAATARDPKRQKQGRIVTSAASSSSRTDEWLSGSHRVAKTITNAVVNRWGDGPDTPSGVRSRLVRNDSEQMQSLMARVQDETIAAAIEGVAELLRRWAATPPGGTLRLTWPLAPRRC
jgi:hypothetical protein